MEKEVKCCYCKRVFLVEENLCKDNQYMQCPICAQIGKNPFYKKNKDEAKKV